MELKQKNAIITIKNISLLWFMLLLVMIIHEQEMLTYCLAAACAFVYVICKCTLELAA